MIIWHLIKYLILTYGGSILNIIRIILNPIHGLQLAIFFDIVFENFIRFQYHGATWLPSDNRVVKNNIYILYNINSYKLKIEIH